MFIMTDVIRQVLTATCAYFGTTIPVIKYEITNEKNTAGTIRLTAMLNIGN
jgi:hypothetical protein